MTLLQNIQCLLLLHVSGSCLCSKLDAKRHSCKMCNSRLECSPYLQGMDELTPMGTADVVEATQDNIRRYVLEPKDLGINRWAALPDPKHHATS